MGHIHSQLAAGTGKDSLLKIGLSQVSPLDVQF
jgi:hypothetical protein